MELVISKDQNRSLLGGITFQIRAQIKVTADEAALVKKYGIGKMKIAAHRIARAGKGAFDLGSIAARATSGGGMQDDVSRIFSVDQLISGVKIDTKVKGDADAFADLQEAETMIFNAAKNLRTYLTVLRDFGGEITVRFNDDGEII